MSQGSPTTWSTGLAQHDYRTPRPPDSDLNPTSKMSKAANSANPAKLLQAKSKGMGGKAAKWTVYKLDEGMPKSSPSNTNDGGLQSHRGRPFMRTMKLDIVSGLQEAVAGNEQHVIEGLTPLTQKQALILLEIIAKVIHPALESIMQTSEHTYRHSDLRECANSTAIKICRNQVSSNLVDGKTVFDAQSQTKLTMSTKRLFREQIIMYQPLPLPEKPARQKDPAMDLSRLDAGETVPAPTRSQASPPRVPSRHSPTTVPEPPGAKHKSESVDLVQRQEKSSIEPTRANRDACGLPGRPRGRPPKSRGVVTKQVQYSQRERTLKDECPKLPGRHRGRPPMKKDNATDRDSSSKGTRAVEHQMFCPSWQTRAQSMRPKDDIPNSQSLKVEDLKSHSQPQTLLSNTASITGAYPEPLTVRVQRRHMKLEMREQRQAKIASNYSSLYHADTQKPNAIESPRKASSSPWSSRLFRELGHSRPDRIHGTTVAQEGYYHARSWQRASGDVITGAWHRESGHYVVGATATTDRLNLQYNRPYNLMFGDLADNTLQELADHNIDAPQPNNANISNLAMTVETVRFGGDQFYTASHDKTVKTWDMAETPVCTNTVRYEHEASLLEVSPHNGTVAVGTKRVDDALHVFNPVDSHQSYFLGSSRAKASSSLKIYPSCMSWGPSPSTQGLLLAGFLRWGESPDGDFQKEGHLCLWDITTGQELIIKPSAQGVYTSAWCPRMHGFAAGGVPGQKRMSDRRTQSVVRVWDLRVSQTRYTFELECPAQDQGEVSFHPRDDNLLVVSCTDGTSYVYDCRNPDSILHRLHHGNPIENNWVTGLDSGGHTREQGDGGVMLCEWGNGRNLLYTGASDGIMKAWDVHRAFADVFVRNVAHFDSGITFGEFSPDYSSLLVGDAGGGVHLLSNDHRDGDLQVENVRGNEGEMVPRQIQLMYAESLQGRRNTCDETENPGTEGIQIAKMAVQSHQIVIDHRLGARQGERYRGPYNLTDAHPPIDISTRAGLLEERRQKLDAARRVIIKQKSRLRRRSGSLVSSSDSKRGKLENARDKAVEVIDLTNDAEVGAMIEIIDLDGNEDLAAGRKQRKVVTPPQSLRQARTGDVSDPSVLRNSNLLLEDQTREDRLEEDHWFPDEDPLAIACPALGGLKG